MLKEIIFKDFFMQSVVITGGNGGIGSAVVNYFLQNGYRVFCLDITQNCEKQENLISIACDITSEQSVKNAFEIVAKDTSEISAVINLAGVYRMDSLIEIDFERLKNTYDINLFGACLVNKIFFPLYKDKGRVIIVTSELAPQKIMPFNGLYMLTKSALDKYAQGLRAELSLLGIKVITVRPGAINTGMIDKSNQEMYALCERSKLYSANTKKFFKIMNSISSKNIPPEKLAKLLYKAVNAKKPKMVYKINQGFLLKIFSSLPEGFRNFLLKNILK